MKSVLRVTVVLLCVLIFGVSGVLAEKISVEDISGRVINLSGSVKRVLALSCTLREVVYLLKEKAPDVVVGLEAREGMKQRQGGKYPCGRDLPYMAAYPEFSKLPVVRRGGTLNLEEIVKLHPDVVFVAFMPSENAAKLQEKIRIPVVLCYAGPLGSERQWRLYFKSLTVMGKVLGVSKRVSALVDYMKGEVASLKRRTGAVKKRYSAYIAGRAYYGMHGLLGTDPQWPPLRWVNAENVASHLSQIGKAVSISKEALLKWNPDYIFVSEASLQTVMSQLKEPIYSSLKALKERHVYGVLPYCWFAYNKGSAIADAYYIGKVMYPERFKDVDPVKKADKIYRFMIGRPVYKKMKDIFGGFKKLGDELLE